ncbi:MAG: thiamine-phosphate pyrophosphorylase [Elusimicrobia bacterium]|nr:thiamine-phosphate pyrophosphorylase [Candidatus Liberimonas magnetica]
MATNKMQNAKCKMQNELRLIDANLNRCREGLRVIEDTLRFILDDGKLYKKVRSLRHKLETGTKKLYPELISNRDSSRDAGRSIKEGRRGSIKGILIANFKRSQESLRVLEEYSRLIASGAGRSFKEIRYSVYDIEKKALTDMK